MGFEPPNLPIPKETKRRLGIETLVNALNKLVGRTIGDNFAGKTVKAVGTGECVGVFASAMGATPPVIEGIAAGTAMGTGLLSVTKAILSCDDDYGCKLSL